MTESEEHVAYESVFVHQKSRLLVFTIDTTILCSLQHKQQMSMNIVNTRDGKKFRGVGIVLLYLSSHLPNILERTMLHCRSNALTQHMSIHVLIQKTIPWNCIPLGITFATQGTAWNKLHSIMNVRLAALQTVACMNIHGTQSFQKQKRKKKRGSIPLDILEGHRPSSSHECIYVKSYSLDIFSIN